MLRGIRRVGSGVRRLRRAHTPQWLRPDALGLLIALLVVGGGAAAGLAASGVIESESAPTGSSHPTPPSPAAELHPKVVAHRVERLRGLRFERIPQVRVLGKTRFSMAIRDIGLREQKRASRAASSRHVRRESEAAQRLLKLAAVVPPDFDFGSGQQAPGLEIAGVYDPGRKRVLIPRQLAAAGPDQADGYVAHELTHALDDQHFGIELPAGANPYAEATGAFEALGEGDASYVQLLYARRYGGSTLSARQQIRQQAAGLAVPLTPPLTKAALFPYIGGANFVAALHQRGGWALVDRAWRSRHPQTSQQILHPGDYLAGLRPLPVSLPAAKDAGSDWKPVGAGSVGEEDTQVLLGVGLRQSAAARVADGWGGGRFEVWGRRGAPACIGACRPDSAAVISWRWRTKRSATLFAGAMHDYATLGFLAKPAGPLTWRLEDGYLAATPLLHSSAIAFAPTATLARTLSRRAALRAG
jgi:hypothetical protein